MCKIIYSSRQVFMKDLFTELEKKIVQAEQEGYHALGPANVLIKDGFFYAYITMKK